MLLSWLAPDDLKLDLPKAGVHLEEDGFEAPVDRVGHGLQRAFILSLLQNLATAVATPSQDEGAEGGEGSEEQKPQIPNLILGIEEPELYQHPSRQRHFAKTLMKLSQGHIPGAARRTQVVYCTHSPLFVHLESFHQVRRLSKTAHPEAAGGDDRPLVSVVQTNDLNEIANRLEAAQDQKPANPFTSDSVRARLHALITPWTNEGFFADAIVLVEGDDDRAVVLGASAHHGLDLEGHGVAVMPAMGKNNLDRLYLIFSQLRIPLYVIWDGDAKTQSGDKANRILQRLLGAGDCPDFPATQVRDGFTVFEDKLETELMMVVGSDLYDAVAGTFTREYGYMDRSACKKSSLFFSNLLTQAAKEKTDLGVFAEIARKLGGFLPSPLAPAQADAGQDSST